MRRVPINFSLDPTQKEGFKKACQGVDISMSRAVEYFMKRFINLPPDDRKNLIEKWKREDDS